LRVRIISSCHLEFKGLKKSYVLYEERDEVP
jgi:hypothetical protein